MNSVTPIDVAIYPWHERLISALLSMSIFIVAAAGLVVGVFWFECLPCIVIALLAAQAVREDFLDLMDAFRQMWRAPCAQ